MSSNQDIRLDAPKSLDELRVRAEALMGYSIAEVASFVGVTLGEDNTRTKGVTGQLVERILGADPTAGENPDFPGLGVELKTIPVKVDGSPVESTFVCSIDMAGAAHEEWESSRLRRRLGCVLWVPVESSRLAPLPERKFMAPRVWRPTSQDWIKLEADWMHLMGAIGAGRGATLSAREGAYIQVRPKASNAQVRTLAPGAEGYEMSLPLGFYFRSKATASILRSGMLDEHS